MRLEVLASKRAAYVAATTDNRVMQESRLGSEHSARLSHDDFRSFLRSVWVAEGRREPLYITRIDDLPTAVQEVEFAEAAAAARWAIPAADRLGEPRVGELVGTTGPVAYIDVKDEGLSRLIALHELAHLLVDSLALAQGHGELWIDAYTRLISVHLGQGLANLWRAEFQWWSRKAAEKIALDPRWLGDGSS